MDELTEEVEFNGREDGIVIKFDTTSIRATFFGRKVRETKIQKRFLSNHVQLCRSVPCDRHVVFIPRYFLFSLVHTFQQNIITSFSKCHSTNFWQL